MEDSAIDLQNVTEDAGDEEPAEEGPIEKEPSDASLSQNYVKKCLKIDIPWSNIPPVQPSSIQRPNKYRFQKPIPRPRLKRKIKNLPKLRTSREKLPLSQIVKVAFLRKNPYVSGIMRVDGIANIPEAAAVTAWSTVETALLILDYLEGKKEEMRALRHYACEAVTTFFQDGPNPEKCQIEGCPCGKNLLSTPFIPMEYSMFYNHQFSKPLYLWPYEKDFNIFVGLRAIDEYIRLRINWMKQMNFGISYDHCETIDSSVRHIYLIRGCNMRAAYPIGQATFNLVFVIISSRWGADPDQRVSTRFFVEGNPKEFIPMFNDHNFTHSVVRYVTNRRIRYYSKFHLTESMLHKEHSTDKQMNYKKTLVKNYKKALESTAALTSKKTVSIPAYTTLCGFCIAFNGQCAIHQEKCQWEELFTPETVSKAQKALERELDNTVKCSVADIFWPDIKRPMKTLFERDILLW